MAAGFVSDKVFGSRRGPVAALLYVVTPFAVTVVMILSLPLDKDFLLGSMAALAFSVGDHRRPRHARRDRDDGLRRLARPRARLWA